VKKYDVTCEGRAASIRIDADQFHYQRESGEILDAAFSMEAAGRDSWSVVMGGRAYQVVLSASGEVWVNGRPVAVEVFDPRSLRGRNAHAGTDGPKNVSASMPGKVVRVLVAVGDDVEQGQGLVVVEAMKMQNEMKSPKPGRIAAVKTAAGATVTAGEVLVVVE
jgi:biotin carboxyl carrier protein